MLNDSLANAMSNIVNYLTKRSEWFLIHSG